MQRRSEIVLPDDEGIAVTVASTDIASEVIDLSRLQPLE
jgi:hypothetical protein